MSSEINRIRDWQSKVRFGSKKPTEGATDLPLDHRLTFCPEKDEKWTFESEHIYFNDYDVNELINGNSNDIRCLCGLSSAIDQYRQFVWKKGGKSAGKFNGIVNALLEKILGRLSSIYDGLFRGLRFEYTSGDFWINGVNIRTVLRLYMIKPTEKARRYLLGLKNKLGLILSPRNGSARYDGIKPAAEELFNEISLILDQVPADDAYRALPPHRAI